QENIQFGMLRNVCDLLFNFPFWSAGFGIDPDELEAFVGEEECSLFVDLMGVGVGGNDNNGAIIAADGLMIQSEQECGIDL
ncbi:hypothetical protein HDU76_007938, partial [Blyttiomyces sp. JEL0837]